MYNLVPTDQTIKESHFSEVLPGPWARRWPNFTPQEMACHSDGALLVHCASLDKLQALRDAVFKLDGRGLHIVSAYRTRAHNAAVGGAAGSMHLAGRAYDVRMEGHDPHEVEALARDAGFTGFGYYPDSANPFMHIDTGPERWWGEPFPFGEDENPAPEFKAHPRPAVEAEKPRGTIAEFMDKLTPDLPEPTACGGGLKAKRAARKS